MSRRKSSILPQGYRATPRDISQLRSLIAQAFQESQKTIASHRKLIISLTNVQEMALDADLENEFNRAFCECINRVLPVKKSEKSADRVVKLVQEFSKHIQNKFSAKESEDNEEIDTPATKFADTIIRHLLRGINAKDKSVRSRCCQIIAAVVNGLQEIDDDLYDKLKFDLSKRLYDKEQSVRLNSALALTRLQDDPNEDVNGTFSITKLLLSLLQHDPSPEVRRAILLNLDKTPYNLPFLLERASDIHPINRRFVYAHTMKEIGDFRLLKIGMREKLLQWGLKDRDQAVRKTATNMFLGLWLHNANDDLLELLERLDVLNSKIAGPAMDIFFTNRRDALDKMEFTQDFWDNLTPESIFLVRKFNDFCIKEKLDDLLDSRMPELTRLAFTIEKYLNMLQQDPSDDELEFIVEQLLIIAESYDFADEVGRGKMLSLIRDAILNNDTMNDTLVECSVAIIRKLSVKEDDFSQVIVELISDVKDKLEESRPKTSDDEDEEEDEEEFEEKETTTILKCLSIAKNTLILIDRPIEENLYLSSLIDTLVYTSVRNHDSRIRERGLFCLGLCCLLSRKLAIDSLELFLQCFSHGDTTLKVMAINTISDILALHGTSVLGLDDNVDTLAVYKMYYKAVRNDDDPETQTVAAQSLCKLLLAGVIKEPDLVKTLVVVYFNPESSYNTSLRQALSFSIPVYCHTSVDNQKIMAAIAVDSLRRLTQIYDTTEEEDMVSPLQIFQQLVEWTNPNNVVHIDSYGELVKGGGSDDTQVYMAIDMMNRLLDDNEPDKDERKALINNFSKLWIPSTISSSILKELLGLVDEYIDGGGIHDSYSKNSMFKLKHELETKIKDSETLEKKNAEKEDDEDEIDLDKYRVDIMVDSLDPLKEVEKSEEQVEDVEMVDVEDDEKEQNGSEPVQEVPISDKNEDEIEEEESLEENDSDVDQKVKEISANITNSFVEDDSVAEDQEYEVQSVKATPKKKKKKSKHDNKSSNNEDITKITSKGSSSTNNIQPNSEDEDDIMDVINEEKESREPSEILDSDGEVEARIEGHKRRKVKSKGSKKSKSRNKKSSSHESPSTTTTTKKKKTSKIKSENPDESLGSTRITRKKYAKENVISIESDDDLI